MNLKNLGFGAATVLALAAMVAAPAFAEDNGSNRPPQGRPEMGRGMMETRDGSHNPRSASSTQPMMPPAIVGKVTAINGNTITLASRMMGPHASSSATTTFSVDASSAKVIKGQATSTVSSIVVGDNIVVFGKLSGTTTITATLIRDGEIRMMGGDDERGRWASSTNATSSDDHRDSPSQGEHRGFLNGVGNFFKHIFGF